MLLYSKNFEDELKGLIDKLLDMKPNISIKRRSEAEEEEVVRRYEELVPELRDYVPEFESSDIMESVTEFFISVIDKIDLSPAKDTKVIKRWVSDETRGILREFLINTQKDSSLLQRYHERLGNMVAVKANLRSIKYSLITEAHKNCLKLGNITMKKAIRDQIKKPICYTEVFREAADAFGVDGINKVFAWICGHEMDILREIVFFMDVAVRFSRSVEEEYIPASDDLILAILRHQEYRRMWVKSGYKYGEEYNAKLEESLDDIVKDLSGKKDNPF